MFIVAARIQLSQGDKRTRLAMRRAHEDGRHIDAAGDVPADVLAHWAACCADCYWYAFYTEREATDAARRVPGSNRRPVFVFAREVSAGDFVRGLIAGGTTNIE